MGFLKRDILLFLTPGGTRGVPKKNHIVFRLNNIWMGKKVFELTMAEIWFFSRKNLGCCLIGHLHIQILTIEKNLPLSLWLSEIKQFATRKNVQDVQQTVFGKPADSLKLRDWHFGFETSRFRDFCQFFKGFGFGGFGFGEKVSVSENSVSEKVSVSVSEKLVSEVSLSFGEFGLGKKFPFRKIWSKKKSLGFGFGKLDSGNEKSKITRKTLDQVNSANILFELWFFLFYSYGGEEKRVRKRRKILGEGEYLFFWRRIKTD